MKKVFIILFFVVLMAGLVITCNPTYAFANEQDYVVDDLCEIYTDTYSPNGIDLYQYVNDFNYFI